MRGAGDSDRFLPDDVRKKYASTLAEKGSIWITVASALLLLLLFNVMEPPLWLGILLLILGVAAARTAYAEWRKKRFLAGVSDALLEVQYKEYSSRQRFQRILAGAIVVLVVAALLFSEDMRRTVSRFFSAGSVECKVVRVEEDVIITDNGFDAGYKIVTSIKNLGSQRSIDIFAELSSSEGEFRRQQKVVFRAGETKALVYRFHEPSINATNIQGRVACS